MGEGGSLGLGCIALLNACVSQTPLPAVSEDGLNLVANSNFDALYIRQGTDFEKYAKLSIQPVTIAYSDERRTMHPILRDEDFQFSEKELGYFQERSAKGFIEGIEKSNTDKQATLIVRSTIKDFYLVAPIKINLIQPNKNYVNESSRMEITTELIDANSQAVLLRVSDDIETGYFNGGSHNLRPMNSVTYWQDVYREFRRWGHRIKTAIN